MKTRIIIFFAILLAFSCERIMFREDEGSEEPRDNFLYLWHEVDEKYSFFEVKKINWDSIYLVYEPRIYGGLSDDSLFSILGSMLNELRDGHVNLVSYFNVSHFNIDRLGPLNYDARIVEENYLPDDFHVSGPFVHDFLANGEIGYVRFSAFSGLVDDKNLNFVLDRYKDTKGLILDIRQNGGGTPLDIYAILSRFVSDTIHVYDSRIKNGPAHDDFSELQPAKVFPSKEKKYTKNVALLTDRGSYSASSFFALACKALPNIVQIGDSTGGGLGLPNGGQLPNGWQYRFSVTQALDLQGHNYEPGVPPDIRVIMTPEDRFNGVDPVIEMAIQVLLAQ